MGFWKRLGWLIEKKKFLRRLSLVWSLLTVSITVGVFLERLYNSPESVTPAVATVLTAIIGLVAVVEGIYNYSRGQEDQK